MFRDGHCEGFIGMLCCLLIVALKQSDEVSTSQNMMCLLILVRLMRIVSAEWRARIF
jgi:lipid-A-disaccharide synthase-like uncharacterized protein